MRGKPVVPSRPSSYKLLQSWVSHTHPGRDEPPAEGFLSVDPLPEEGDEGGDVEEGALRHYVLHESVQQLRAVPHIAVRVVRQLRHL